VNYVHAVLIAEARKKGRAVRSALKRHVHLTPDPMGMVLWQLGAEPFTAAATAWGFGPDDRDMVVPGEPRNRELAFRALLGLAYEFNPWFEDGEKPDGSRRSDLPQIVLPNRGNLTLLRRLGRRLAFLPTDGPMPADPELVRFGKHLSFLTEYARTPGQSLVVVLTDLLSSHWATELSPLEAQNLPALDAWIKPAKSLSGYEAALLAEAVEIGPVPTGQDDGRVDPLVTSFNEQRARATDEGIVAPLRKPIEAHYEGLVDRGWPLLWRVLARERRFPAAEHTSRRWLADEEALKWHLDWVVLKGGRLSTRYTHKRAAFTLKKWEDAQSLLAAEYAIDDPLRMIGSMLKNDAVAGTVADLDDTNMEQGPKRRVRRPLLTLRTRHPCTMPPGKRLWWSGHPKGKPYVIRSVTPTRKGGSRLVLCLQTNRSAHPTPAVGTRATFSVHSLAAPFFSLWPKSLPWTHQEAEATTGAASVEDSTEAWEGA
jgi:hypothetical protein